MTEDEIKAKVHQIIRTHSRASKGINLGPDQDLHGDLGLKVLDTLQLIMDVEDAWEGVIYITDDEAEAIRTVGDLERLVVGKLTTSEERVA